MAEYTKGEWCVSGGKGRVFAKQKDKRPIICDLHIELTPKETIANANLIASAPALFEALKEAKRRFGNANPFWIDIVDKALAEAEGK